MKMQGHMMCAPVVFCVSTRLSLVNADCKSMKAMANRLDWKSDRQIDRQEIISSQGELDVEHLCCQVCLEATCNVLTFDTHVFMEVQLLK